MKAPRSIACIVEGHGEVEAVPILIRRIATRIDPSLSIVINRPLRYSRSTLLRGGEFERAVEFSARQVGPQGSILILLDSDDDCPATLGPQLLNRARSDRVIGLVLANREFEGWFLASAESIRGKRGLRDDLDPPTDPESIRGAKEWMTRHRIDGSTYRETLDQAALTATFDLDLAATRSRSFEKCLREITNLIQATASSRSEPWAGERK